MTTTFTGGAESSITELEYFPFPVSPLAQATRLKWRHFPNVYFVLINSTSAAHIFRQNQ